MKNSQNSNLSKRTHRNAFVNEANIEYVDLLENAFIPNQINYDSNSDNPFKHPRNYEINVKNKDNSLHIDAKLKNVNKPKKLTKKELIKLDEQNKEDCKNLHIAVCNYNIELVKDLIKSGCNLDLKDADGRTPLHVALFKAYLDNSLNPNLQKIYLDIVEYLIESGCNLDLKDRAGNTALHLAVSNNNIELVKYLIESRCNLDLKNRAGNTALHLAVSNKNIELVKVLIKSGCSLDIKNRVGNTALHLVITGNLYSDLSDNDVELVKYLIESGCNLTMLNKYGGIVLHWIVSYCNIELVKAAIESKGCNLDIQDRYGYTALHIALSENNIPAAKALIESRKCNLDIEANNSNTALHIAIIDIDININPNINIIKTLIEHGADVELLCNYEGDSILIHDLLKMLNLVKNIVNNHKKDTLFVFDIANFIYKDLFKFVFETYLKKHGFSSDYNSLVSSINQANLPNDIKSDILNSLESLIDRTMWFESSMMKIYFDIKEIRGLELPLFYALRISKAWGDKFIFSEGEKDFYLDLYKYNDFVKLLTQYFEDYNSLTTNEFNELLSQIKNATGSYITSLTKDKIKSISYEMKTKYPWVYDKVLTEIKLIALPNIVCKQFLKDFAAQLKLVEVCNDNIVAGNQQKSKKEDNQIDSGTKKDEVIEEEGAQMEGGENLYDENQEPIFDSKLAGENG